MSDLSSDELHTFFSKVQKQFPEPIDGKINTCRFLEASESVVILVERLGKVFSPVRYDMKGNIQKITNKYHENPEKYQYLNDMIISEREEGSSLATDALLWLRRALHFVHNFFSAVYQDTQENIKSEDLSLNVQKAYTETLERYHGWMAQQLFKLLSRMVPSRSQLLLALALEQEMSEERIFQDMNMFLTNINSNVSSLVDFYIRNEIETESKCK